MCRLKHKTDAMKLVQLKKKKNLVYCLNNLPINEQVCMIQHLDRDSMKFLISCLCRILKQNSQHLKLNKNQKASAKKLWKNHEKVFKKIEKTNKGKIIQNINKQTGDGPVISALLSAVLPLITSLISKLFEKKSE